MADEVAKHGDEIAYLNRSNKQLKAQLDKFLSPEAAAKK